MEKKYTLLVPSAGDERLLEICLKQIDTLCPEAGVLVVRGQEWQEAFAELWNNCPTDVGVFIDDDCFLYKNPSPAVERVLSGEYDMAAVEEVVPYYRGGFLRYKPGYYQSSFMVVNIGKCKREGIEYWADQHEVVKTPGINGEFHYGLSQRLKTFHIPCCLAGKYGAATAYGDFAVHLWYGAWDFRGELAEGDLRTRDDIVYDDYREGRLFDGVCFCEHWGRFMRL